MFEEEGIVFRRVDGNIEPTQRKELLVEFHNDVSVRVLLMTLGTGAVGYVWDANTFAIFCAGVAADQRYSINDLSVASRLHLLEPQWNPSVENQAVGRLLRLGQKRKVTVVRYIMKSTIEEVSGPVRETRTADPSSKACMI